MSWKIIFDTNAIQATRIQQMVHAGFFEAVERGLIMPYVTSTLISEKLDFIVKPREEWPLPVAKDVQFLLEVPWKAMFREPAGPEGIYVNELEGKNIADYLYYDRQSTVTLLRGIYNEMKGIAPANEEERKKAAGDREEWRQKKFKNKKIHAASRDEMKTKAAELKESRKNLNFQNFKNNLFDVEGSKKIRTSINSQCSKEDLVQYWNAHRDACPYFNKFIEGQLFMGWYAAATDETIDINYYEDIEHLIYLNDADAIVSNEQGFMKAAVNELFPGKGYWSVEDFALKLKLII